MKLRHLAMAMLLVACGSGAGETTLATTTTRPETTTTTEQPATTEQPTTSPTTTGPATTTIAAPNQIRVEGGAKVEGPNTISVAQGEVVSFEVLADVADEVHVHGYDLFFETVPGQPVVIEFTADATGIFEVELEGNHLDLVNIEVTP